MLTHFIREGRKRDVDLDAAILMMQGPRPTHKPLIRPVVEVESQAEHRDQLIAPEEDDGGSCDDLLWVGEVTTTSGSPDGMKQETKGPSPLRAVLVAVTWSVERL